MAAYITVLNYVYSLCIFYYSLLSCVADVADCPLQRLSAIVIKNIMVWWPRVELGTARTMLERIQRLACLAIAGPVRITPTAAMEILAMNRQTS